VQRVIYSEIASDVGAGIAILIKAGTRYGIKFIKYTSKNYIRTEFSSERIFEDFSEASFFAD